MSKNKSKAAKNNSKLLYPSIAEKALEFDMPSISTKNAQSIENHAKMMARGKYININLNQ